MATTRQPLTETARGGYHPASGSGGRTRDPATHPKGDADGQCARHDHDPRRPGGLHQAIEIVPVQALPGRQGARHEGRPHLAVPQRRNRHLDQDRRPADAGVWQHAGRTQRHEMNTEGPLMPALNWIGTIATAISQLWAARSNGRCVFVLATKKNLQEVLASISKRGQA